MVVQKEVAGGRNDQAIAYALEAMIQVVEQKTQAFLANQNRLVDLMKRMGKFQKNNPPTFKGKYDPEGS